MLETGNTTSLHAAHYQEYDDMWIAHSRQTFKPADDTVE
jgi:hypothetical protein